MSPGWPKTRRATVYLLKKLMLSPKSRKQMLTQQQRNNRRRRANPRQLAFLRKKFSEDPKPDQLARENIGRAIDMTPRSVQIWFQNNRAKTKVQERKFSLHGKLYNMTTTACSPNVSCIHAEFGGEHAYETYGHHGSPYISATPVRFYTPQPGRTHLPGGHSRDWWESNSSSSSLDHDFLDSQLSSQSQNEVLKGYGRSRAHSAQNVGHLDSTYLISGHEHHKPAQSFLNKKHGLAKSDMNLDNESPISTTDSLESYDPSFDVKDPYLELSNGETEFSIDFEPESEEISKQILEPIWSFSDSLSFVPNPMNDVSTNECLAARKDVGLVELMNSLELRAPDRALTISDDYIEIPCTQARIGSYISEQNNDGRQNLIARYSVSKQVLQIAITDFQDERVSILERDVLHITKSSGLRSSPLEYSQIDVEVFGSPRVITVDTTGQPLQSFDPTDGEISSVNACTFFGDFDAQLAVLQKVEDSELVDWLHDTVSNYPAQHSSSARFGDDLIHRDSSLLHSTEEGGIPMTSNFVQPLLYYI